MFQTTQSPGTDGTQQVELFSPMATTNTRKPGKRATAVCVWRLVFAISPLFDAPGWGTSCDINAVCTSLKSTFGGLQFRRWQYGSIFIRLAVIASETREMSRNCRLVYWWKDDFHCRGGVKFAERSCVCLTWMLKKQIAAIRLLRTRNTFSQSIRSRYRSMCLNLVYDGVVFRWSRHALNGAYSRYASLRQKLLPAIPRVPGNKFIIPAAGQCTCRSHSWNCGASAPRNTGLHFSRLLAPKQSRSQSSWLKGI